MENENNRRVLDSVDRNTIGYRHRPAHHGDNRHNRNLMVVGVRSVVDIRAGVFGVVHSLRHTVQALLERMNMNFIPEQSKKAADVPYFEDVTSSDGWQGQATTKSMETLKSEIVQAISRLGGTVQSFQRGKFQIGEVEREGFQVSYFIETSTGKLFNGRVDIAALPNKFDPRSRSNINKRREQSLKMALYMFRDAMDGLWFLQQLSPGYAGLIPWILPEGSDETMTQLWSKNAMMDNLLPPGDSDFIEAKYKEV